VKTGKHSLLYGRSSVRRRQRSLFREEQNDQAIVDIRNPAYYERFLVVGVSV